MLLCFVFTCFLDSWRALSVWKFMFFSFENFPWNNSLIISFFSPSIFFALLKHSMLNFVDQFSDCHFPTIFHLFVFSLPLPGKVLQIYFLTLLLNFLYLHFPRGLFFFFFLIYFWLCWVFVSVRGLSLVAASGDHPPFITVRGPLIIAASLVAEHRLQMRRLSNCASRA